MSNSPAGLPAAARPGTGTTGRTAAPAPEATRRSGAALAALVLLLLVYVALAALWAEPGSDVVLATSGGSPDWLLGPLQPFGAAFADGRLSGPLFYAGLWAAMVLYCVVLAYAARLATRTAISAIVGAHLLFALAPPLLSQDAFSYIAYARLDVVHDLNPYLHSPSEIPRDPVFPFAGSKDFTSVYGPLFTVATLPLAKTSVPVAFWTLKAVAALASLGVVALVWWCARRLGRDPRLPALAVGLNPLVLVHVVGGAHNDALTVLLWMGGIAALAGARPMREATAGALTALSGAVKASAGIVAPFMLIGARRRWRLIAGAVVAVLGVLLVAVVAFGDGALESLGALSDNQDRTTRWSLPQRTADALASLTGGSATSIVDYTRTAYLALFLGAVALLLRAAWRRRAELAGWIAPAGWATLALLAASAWLVPWYAIWLMPLAALAADRRLLVASIAFCAYMMVIAMPLEPFSPLLMNEFDLLAKIRACLAQPSDRVLVGSGDDAAVVRPAAPVSVTSVDSFVEGVHFRLATTSMHDLGHKVLAASLSDLAAMGADAGEAYISIGLPHHLGEREVLELAEGARAIAAVHDVAICGGDLTRADELFVAVTVVGYADAVERLATRRGAQPGDLVGVTGALGGSGAGMLLLERKPAGVDLQTGARLIERHLRPQPLLQAGRALAAAGVSAMLDVSDGIASDLERLCEQSGVSIEAQLGSLPLDEGVVEVATVVGVDPLEIAAGAGEDYELLFTAPADARALVERAGEDSGSAVTWIGRVSSGGEARPTLLDATGRPRHVVGWDHLRRDPGTPDLPGPASR